MVPPKGVSLGLPQQGNVNVHGTQRTSPWVTHPYQCTLISSFRVVFVKPPPLAVPSSCISSLCYFSSSARPSSNPSPCAVTFVSASAVFAGGTKKAYKRRQWCLTRASGKWSGFVDQWMENPEIPETLCSCYQRRHRTTNAVEVCHHNINYNLLWP